MCVPERAHRQWSQSGRATCSAGRDKPVEGVSDASVFADVQAKDIDVVVNDLLLLRERLLHRPFHLCGVQKHLSHRDDVEEGVELLDVPSVPSQEALGGLLGREEDIACDLALRLSACSVCHSFTMCEGNRALQRGSWTATGYDFMLRAES